ncbi:short-chain dehydrogenase [Aspergillus avenaceus]|uniref:Short-chain dehydrogenase n=1 Tax=Aspergillus avenaceus TaxID=36643 RepID=A0A5N6TRA6_ASPAV|nr:short-chain dehydrogenase [Aspergillus avenaceus]
MSTFKRIWPQLFPAQAPLTASNLPPQTGKVVIITGSTSGIGLELARILYHAGATVYIAARNQSKAETVIQTLTTDNPHSTGRLVFLPLDLSDLRTIKPFVESFLSAESRLDILFNNAAVASRPPSQRTAQGLEPKLGTNCAAPYLLTQLLSPILVSTAKTSPPNTIRVIWSSSMVVDFLAPDHGVPPSVIETPNPDPNVNYAVSKAGNWFLASRAAKQLGPHGVVSITQNPGNLNTPIYDEAARWMVWLSTPFFYKPVDGASTLLWAGFSSDVTVEDGGRYGIPFGRWHPDPRPDLLEAIRDVEEGGLGYARGLEEWCERVTGEFR